MATTSSFCLSVGLCILGLLNRLFLTQTPNCLLWRGTLASFLCCIQTLSEIHLSACKKTTCNDCTIHKPSVLHQINLLYKFQEAPSNYHQFSSGFLYFVNFSLRQSLYVTESAACGHLDAFHSTNAYRLQFLNVSHVLKRQGYESELPSWWHFHDFKSLTVTLSLTIPCFCKSSMSWKKDSYGGCIGHFFIVITLHNF